MAGSVTGAAAVVAGARRWAIMICAVRTLRRKISARMAPRCSAVKLSVNPMAMISSGHSMVGWIVGPSSLTTLAG